MLPTPDLSHLKRQDYEYIYEPAEDTFLFLDAFEDEVPFLKELQPTISLEVGSGSGCVTAFVGKILGESNCLKFCTDINPRAARATQGTAKQNQLSVDVIETHLTDALLPRLERQIDLMYFNPPYVLTPSEEVGSHSVEAAWAGGIDGREVIDEFLPYVKRLLSAKGAFYLVVVNENKPDDIREIMKQDGFNSSVVKTRLAGRERLLILKFNQTSSSNNKNSLDWLIALLRTPSTIHFRKTLADMEHSQHTKSEPLSGRASELANSFLSELTEELANPMKRKANMTAKKDQIAEAVATEEMEVSTETEKESGIEKGTAPPARDMSAVSAIEAREVTGTDIEVNGATEVNAAARTAAIVTGAANGTEVKDLREASVNVSAAEIAEIGTATLNATKETVEIMTVAVIVDQGEMTGTAMADMAGDQAGAEAQRAICRPLRKLKNWDVPPPGYEDKTVQEVKALGIFPPPGQPAVLRSEILQGMDPERAAQLVHELPPRPLRMNYPPMGAPGGMGGPYGNMGYGFRNNNGPTGANGVDHTLARQQRRLYCGNLPMGINEDSLANFFNQTMMSMNLTTGAGAPVVSVHINYEKNYAFVELTGDSYISTKPQFRTPEEATAAMAFDGIVFQSQTLKIRRPKDYQPPEGANHEVPQIHVPGVISTNVPDSENKIFIGGLPLYLNDEQVIELLTAFGELKAFNLVKENNVGASKGFAFCEYLDPNLTDIACQGLNNMMLGEKKLVVQRASVGSSRNQNPAGGANAIALHPNLMLPGAGATEVVPTNVLQLLNMVTPEELENDDEYDDIVEDVKEECGKFGVILDVKIPRPVAGQAALGVGKIFIKYSNVDEATAALRALSGRKFADRTVLTSFYDVDKFAADEY
ncbi:U2 small nuclear RNA auxiliary factor 2 [Dissophora ornata]|nr:U2 small nuclear RNA auxiliary factor 2 [Dissophora ornata]